MVDQIGLRGSDPRAATGGLRRLAKGETASAETVAWVAACAKSGLCVAACPERSSGLDAMLLVRIAKQRALNETHQLPVKHDPTYFPRIKAFARLQLTDEELAQWL
jgi:Na+-translocating ferredoxin:NAD+ oxidoreductase RnfC subunit